MNRIYLLMFVMIAATVSASAQRNVDLQIKHYYKLGSTAPTTSNPMIDGTHILFDGDEQYKIALGYIIANTATLAPDSVMTSDTLKFRTKTNGGIFQTVAGPGFYLQAGFQTGMLQVQGWPQAVPPNAAAFNNVSSALPVRWCDSVWIVSAAGNPNPAVEADKSDDTTCNNVIIDGWLTGVEDVEVEGNGLLVYPNPAVTRDLNIIYNFGINTKQAVVTIMDLTGRVVYNKIIGTNLRGTQNIALNLGDIAPGMYSVKLATEEKVTIEKICIK